MPEMVNFNKARAEHFLDCLANGKDIKSPEGGWSRFEMLNLAGACLFGVKSQGPVTHDGVEWSDIHGERREAIEESFEADIHGAIEFAGLLTQRVRDGEYDQHCDRECKAITWIEGDERKIRPVEGFREGVFD